MGELREGYAPGWADDAMAMMSSRTASRRAAFLFPFLTSGMRVLDVGCGPGTITLGLAQVVAPEGAVVGIDIERSQVELARLTARRAGVRNVAFQVGSVYALPFADESFDGVLAHALVEHLARPHDALVELRRVLRSGGVVGVRSSDWGGAAVEPRTADVDAALSCHLVLRRRATRVPRLLVHAEIADHMHDRTARQRSMVGDDLRHEGAADDPDTSFRCARFSRRTLAARGRRRRSGDHEPQQEVL